MTVKKKIKKQVNRTKKVVKHSPDLNLRGTPHELVATIKIMKNIVPPDNRWAGGKWDHLIVKLEEGDCIELENKPAAAFANRARSLGYVIVVRKYSELTSRVWFEGWDQNYKPYKSKTPSKK